MKRGPSQGRPSACSVLQLLHGVIHRQGKDNDSQAPHGVVGDVDADQGGGDDN